MTGNTKKFHVISLGCPKARVDTEYILGRLFAGGYEYSDDISECDYVLVNTCAFIDPAKEESIDTLFGARSEMKPGARLVAVGCLAERYGDVLTAEMPEVDLWVGVSALDSLPGVLEKTGLVRKAGGSWIPSGLEPRIPSLSENWAYLKIAEGCNRSCAFCAVPGIRGAQKSLPPDLLVREAERLADMGARELVLIAQDLTTYGADIGVTLEDLVKKLNEISGLQWIRLLYLYPGPNVGSLVERLLSHEKVLPYVDIPIQHVSDPVLRAMKRGYTEDIVRRNIEHLRSLHPGMVIRSTVLVGHPGETEDDFARLLDFIGEGHIDHLGAFAYSPEEGTAAYGLDAPPPELAEERRRLVEQTQLTAAKKRYQNLVGTEVPALVDGFDPESMTLYGRFYGQAPEIDGEAYFDGIDARPGDIIRAKITAVPYPDVVLSPAR